MNDYGFDYMNYITTIPNSMKYNHPQETNIKYKSASPNTPSINYTTTSSNKSSMSYKIPIPNTPNITSQNKTLDPTQGWLRGNLFANQYEPYKNYKPAELNPQTERETLLYQVMQYKFALTELNLYLDTNPNDTEMIKLYNQYLNIEKQMTDKYESMYGPLTLDSNYLNKNTWNWNNKPWPWEVM